MCELWSAHALLLLVCDRCVKVDNKSSMRVLGGMGNMDRLIIWDCWYMCGVMNHRFNDDKDGWLMLCEKELDRWSTCQ